MGALYIYAIVDQPDLDLPYIKGIDDAVIYGLRTGDLMAIVSAINAATVPLSRENLLWHERVIEALMDTRTVLPMHFGTTTEQAERLLTALATNSANYHTNLDRVRGRVEIALRVGWEPEPEAPVARPRTDAGTNGRDYMLALMAQTKQSQRRLDTAKDLVATLTAGLADLADASVENVLPTPQLLLKAAYLVRHEHVAEIRRRIEALRTSHPDLAILATGPWPAYSFIEEGKAG